MGDGGGGVGEGERQGWVPLPGRGGEPPREKALGGGLRDRWKTQSRGRCTSHTASIPPWRGTTMLATSDSFHTPLPLLLASLLLSPLSLELSLLSYSPTSLDLFPLCFLFPPLISLSSSLSLAISLPSFPNSTFSAPSPLPSPPSSSLPSLLLTLLLDFFSYSLPTLALFFPLFILEILLSSLSVFVSLSVCVCVCIPPPSPFTTLLHSPFCLINLSYFLSSHISPPFLPSMWSLL